MASGASHRVSDGEAALVPQRIVFTYHKTGTVLFDAVLRGVAERFGLGFALHYGFVRHLDPAPDIVLLPHSLIGFYFSARPFRAVRVVRDPRDIWVSGYLYHRHCPEGWCTNSNFDPTSPITYPRVDFSFQHYPEPWKEAYLARLGGRSYQQNLLDRDRDSGLAFELAGYTGCTLDTMRGWWLDGLELLTVQLEALTQNFDAEMRRIFRHLGFDEDQCNAVVEIAAPHDIGRMSDAAIAENPHIHSRTISKWREYLSPAQLAAFERRYGDLIVNLGYRLSTEGE